jgi:hypothetical protein
VILLPLLDVAFIGLVGPDPGHVSQQILAAEPQLVIKKVTTSQLATIAKRDDGAADAVTSLDVDGVVTGELVGDARHRSLRLVIYRANGAMASLSETPLVRNKLGKDDVEVLQSNLGDEVGELISRSKKPARPGKADKADKVEKKAGPATQMADTDPFSSSFDEPAKPAKPTKQAKVAKAEPKPKPEPKPEPKLEPKPEPKAAKKAKAQPVAEPDPVEAIINGSAPAAAPAAPKAAPKQVAVADTADSDSVSADEVAAMTGGDPASDTALATAASPIAELPDLHLAATAGFGVVGRGFAPGPNTLTGYQANGVGAVHLDGVVEPLPHARLAVSLDTTVGMNSAIGTAQLPTTISRWEFDAGYGIQLGKLEIAPEIGLGIRSFSMTSSATDRTPDNTYTYLIAGVEATLPVTSRVTAHVLGAIEPVIDGTDPLAMQYGSATRWAFDVGGSIDIRATDHFYVRALSDYQQFSWSWSMAGARGAAGATDSYPTAALALAARY